MAYESLDRAMISSGPFEVASSCSLPTDSLSPIWHYGLRQEALRALEFIVTIRFALILARIIPSAGGKVDEQ